MKVPAGVCKDRGAGRYYRPELDILRFAAFLIVFLGHLFPTRIHLSRWQAAWGDSFEIGVPLFFTLSAYLITELLSLEWQSTGTLRLKAFYIRRALRIWPLYFVVVGIGFTVCRLSSHARMSIPALAAYMFFAGNWYTAVYGYLPYGIGPLWSISVEEQFYLAWPLVVRFLPRRRLIWVCLIAYAISQSTVITLSFRHILIEPTLWTNTLLHLQYLAIGAGISLILNSRLPSLNSPLRILFIVFAAALVWYPAYIATFSSFAPFASSAITPIQFMLVGVAAALTLIAFLGAPSLAGYPMLRYLGKISYGLYVYHRPSSIVLELFASHFRIGYQDLWLPVLELPLTIGVASLSYRFVESPFLRFKKGYEIIRSRTV